MPRRPEIGNVQLYPDRPLRRSDRNGYVLKFYCPILRKRIRRNCGTRDRREARKLQRECQERLLNGEYLTSDGAISASHMLCRNPFRQKRPNPVTGNQADQRGRNVTTGILTIVACGYGLTHWSRLCHGWVSRNESSKLSCAMPVDRRVC
jgi:hypothetical protein